MEGVLDGISPSSFGRHLDLWVEVIALRTGRENRMRRRCPNQRRRRCRRRDDAVG